MLSKMTRGRVGVTILIVGRSNNDEKERAEYQPRR